MSKGVYKTAPKEVILARPAAIDFSHKVNNYCNENFGDNGGTMALLVASLVFQNLLISATIDIEEPGSQTGIDKITAMYNSAIKDAVERWQDNDLKIAKKAMRDAETKHN